MAIFLLFQLNTSDILEDESLMESVPLDRLKDSDVPVSELFEGKDTSSLTDAQVIMLAKFSP